MEWDQEKCLKLITEYKNLGLLWNPRDRTYYNKLKKENAWKILAEKIECSIEEVKKKIESLKGSYRREKTRVKRSRGKGKDRQEIYESRWFAYHHMHFLNEKNFRTVSDDEESGVNDGLCDSKDFEVDEEIIGSQAEEGIDGIRRKKKVKSSKRRSLKRKKIEVDSRTMDGYEHLQEVTTTSNQGKDQCSLFGDYIAEKLRKLDNCRCAVAQYRISNVLFELEMDAYQNIDSVAHTSRNHTDSIDTAFYPHTSHFSQNNQPSSTPIKSASPQDPLCERSRQSSDSNFETKSE